MSTHHARHSSHYSKKVPPHARPSHKPQLLSRRSLSSGKGSHKFAHRKEVESEEEDDDDESMAVSFLNYCAVCEKQIVVPSNSVLYCSQSCRKKDTEKSLLNPYGPYSPPSTPFANLSSEDLTFRDIVPQRCPTQSESKRSSCASSVVSSDDNHTSTDERSQRPDSEAARYLRQFQSSSSYTAESTRPSRPRCSRASTSQISLNAVPSLSHTPMSMGGGFSLPYTPSTTRPLPPRNRPYSSSYGSKSIGLVTPLTAPSSPKQYSHKTPPILTTSTSTIEGEIVYAKSPIPRLSATNGSLSRLMASTPR